MRNDTGVYEGGEISIHYDPMIAKLVTHARRPAERDRGAGQRARRLRDRRHPPQHSLPLRADAARALARGTAVDRLHRRGISRRLLAAGRRRARREPVIAAVAAHVDHVHNMRKREISGQLRAGRNRCLRSEARRPARRDARSTSKSSRATGGVDVVFADGRRLRVDSPWTPGEPVWRGDIDEKPIAVQVRADPQRLRARPSRRRVEARVYTHREAALAALMIERKGADQSRALLCPMPGLVKSIAVKEGQEVQAPATRSASSRR